MRYKDLSTIQSDSYYSIAENILEESEIDFIFAGVREYIDGLLFNKEKYNIKNEDIEDFFEIFIIKASEFYYEYLENLSNFQDLSMLDKVDIIYLFLIDELPKWIYDETDYEDDELAEDDNKNVSTSDEPYDISKIDIINQQFEVQSLYKKYKREEKELDLSPDYQRNFVWTSRQKSKLIESILIGIPLPIFYIDTRNEDKWLVIDGLQRLTTIFTYMDDEFKLMSLQYLNHLKGKKFSQLERKYQRRIEDFQLLCNLVRPNTPSKIAFNIFQRINTLGTQLAVQEMRNAMFRGKSTALLTKLAKSDEFISIITEKKVKGYAKRMKDHAIILRYLSFSITHYLGYINNDMNEFLENTMEKINHMNDLEIKSLENTFKECMIKAKVIFEENAFAKLSDDKSRSNPISMPLFESLGYSLEHYSLDEIINNKSL